MMLCGKNTVDELRVEDIDTMEYHNIKQSEAWRIGLLKEIVAIKEDEAEVPGMTDEEITDIMNYICTT